MIEERSHDTGRGSIAYWLEPSKENLPTLVYLHGLSSNHTSWDGVISQMQALGYGTLALDLRGHGHSDKTRERSLYKIPVMREDLEEILKKEEMKNFVIVGYSYGAYIALDFAIESSLKGAGLVLISASHVSPFKYHWSSFINPLVRYGTNLLGWLLVWQSRKRYHYFDPKRAVGYWRSTLTGYATMPLSINFWMLSEIFALNFARKLERINTRTLIIRGREDPFTTERELYDMHRKIKNSKVVTISAGHYVASNFVEECVREIKNFLQTK